MRVPWLPSTSRLTAQLRLQQMLSREGDVGDLVVHATFDDGHQQALSAGEVTARSLSTGAAVSRAVAGWLLTVQVGASRQCGDLVEVEWRVCDQLLATGGYEGVLRLFDAATGECERAVRQSDGINHLRWSPPPSPLALAWTTDDGSVLTAEVPGG